jgi:hypothetical protein
LAAQLAACGGKAIGCPVDAPDCVDGSEDTGQGGTGPTGSIGLGGSLGLGGSAVGGSTGPSSSGETSSGQGGTGQSGGSGRTNTGTSTRGSPTAPNTGAGGTSGLGTAGEGNVAPTGFAGAAGARSGSNSGSNNPGSGNAGSNSGTTSGAAGVSGSGGATASPSEAPPCPAVAPGGTTPRPTCMVASPIYPGQGNSCTENWCNMPSMPAVVSCTAVGSTLRDAYHYTLNGDAFDATFTFDADLSRAGEYPTSDTFVSLRMALQVGVTNNGTPIVDRIEVPAAQALAQGLDIIDHTIVGTLTLTPGDLEANQSQRPMYESGCIPILNPEGLATPGLCACGFGRVSLKVPVYLPLERIQ